MRNWYFSRGICNLPHLIIFLGKKCICHSASSIFIHNQQVLPFSSPKLCFLGGKLMGHRSSVTTVASGVDSSPSSAESSFRELDDVFLQTQTRMWLAEVLNIRLDEEMSISDLLADGELLFEVSKMVWSMLLEKCVELRHIKAYQCPLGSRKSSGRYKPYSNVDSFLKVCKILGLNGIDLFSPSDVVEKKNIRKVCICIRAISKKARSKHLNVPDFDLVTYAVVMPTDMVGCIRRSLESSQCTVSSYSSSNSSKQTRSRNQQRKLTSSQSGNYDSCSEESDEAESAYFGIESYSLSTEKSDHPAILNSDIENSPSAFSSVKQYSTVQVASRSDMRNPYRNGKSCYLHHSRTDHQANSLSTCHFKAQGDLQNKDVHTNNVTRESFENVSVLADVDLALGNDDLDIGDSMFENIAGTDFISDYLAFSDSVVLGNNGSSPVFFDGEDNICNFFMSIDSHGLESRHRTLQNGFHQKSLDDMEDVEVSSTTSMSSILGRVLNMEFDDQYNASDSSMVKFHSLELFEKQTDSEEKGLFMEDQTQASSQDEVLSQCSVTDIKESQSAMELENEGSYTKFLSIPSNNEQLCCMKSQKLESCGDSQILGITFSTKNTYLVSAENDKTVRSIDSKTVIGVTDLNGDLEQVGNAHIPANSLHHKIFTEEKVSCHKCSVEGNGSQICSSKYENVLIENVSSPVSHEELDGTLVNHDFASLTNKCEVKADKHPISFAKNVSNITGGGHQAYTGKNGSTPCSSDGNEDYQNENNIDISTENVLDGKTDPRCGTQEDKLRRRSLLKTVVKGTTLIGVLFFLLHIRKGKEDTDKQQKPVKPRNFGGAMPTSQREQRNTPNGTYPAEKLKFGR